MSTPARFLKRHGRPLFYSDSCHANKNKNLVTRQDPDRSWTSWNTISSPWQKRNRTTRITVNPPTLTPTSGKLATWTWYQDIRKVKLLAHGRALGESRPVRLFTADGALNGLLDAIFTRRPLPSKGNWLRVGEWDVFRQECVRIVRINWTRVGEQEVSKEYEFNWIIGMRASSPRCEWPR